MNNLNKISAEARAKRIAEKLAHQNEIEELVEFLDSAIEQSPKFAWGLTDIPSKDIYEKTDDIRFMNIVNSMNEPRKRVAEKLASRSFVRPYIHNKFRRISKQISDIDYIIKNYSGEVRVVIFERSSPLIEQSQNKVQIFNYSKLESTSEKSVDSSYHVQNVILEPFNQLVQLQNKNTKT